MCVWVCVKPSQVDAGQNIIPAHTRVDSYITVNRETCSCDLLLKTNNESVIRGAVVFGEQIFTEESLFVYPKVCVSVCLCVCETLSHSLVLCVCVCVCCV